MGIIKTNNYHLITTKTLHFLKTNDYNNDYTPENVRDNTDKNPRYGRL